MALTVCHTGDWHLGHTLYRRSRELEHAAFLAWLLEQLSARTADALIVAGDVFDSGSPSGAAQAMFYGFLAEARRRLPGLAIVVVAGNHDSPARLAAPDALLRERGVSLVGSVLDEQGRVDVERLVIPLRRAGRIEGVVAAVPFLRGADVPPLEAGASSEEDASHAAGCRRVYDLVLAYAREVAQGAPVIATGHFAAAGAQMSRDSERLLAVGVDGTLPLDVVDPSGVSYLALGHLHLPQLVRRWPEGEARYAGAPIPLSFAERGFAHEVRFVRLDGGRVQSEGVRIPRRVELVRIPDEGLLDAEAAIELIAGLPPRGADDDDASWWPWLEVRARARAGERGVLERIEAAAGSRAVHLTRVVVDVPDEERERVMREATALASLDVRDVLGARWLAEHGAPPPPSVLDALDEATREARARLEARPTRAVELEARPTRAVEPEARPTRGVDLEARSTRGVEPEGERAWVRTLATAARRRELED